MFRDSKIGFTIFGIEITVREIIASVAIIAFLSFIGFFISSKITQFHMDKVEEYNKAAKINTQELFAYGMNTNIGNAFVYGELKAVDAITNPEIQGEYMYLNQVTEAYTQHLRVVSNGKTSYTQIYYTWDEIDENEHTSQQLSFCNITFPSNKFKIPNSHYIDTVEVSRKLRHVYYGTSSNFIGTVYTKLYDNTISEHSPFYANQTIEDCVKGLDINIWSIVFWIFWIVFIIACVIGFCYFDNNWMY